MNSGDTVRHKLMPLVKSGKVPYTRRVYYAEKEKAERLDTVDRELELIEKNLKKNDIDIPENGDSGESQPDCAVQIKGKGKKTKIFKTIKYPFQYYDIIFAVFSIILFFYDVVSDVLLAVHYYALNRWVAFGFTTGFIVLPALISNGQSARWYLVDYEQEQKKLSKKPKTEVTPFRIWALRIFFTFPLMLGPVVRHSEFIYHGIKSKSGSDATEKERKKKWHHYKQMLYEDTDAGLVRMFECFLEAAPQLVLQLFILFREIIENGVDGNNDLVEHGHMKIIRVVALVGSWIGLSFSLTSYHKALRAMQHSELHEKYVSKEDQNENHKPKKQSLLATLMLTIGYFSWRMCEIGPRVLILALFASKFTYFVLVAAAIHWIIMTLWLLCQKTSFYGEKRRDEVIFNIILGYAMIFCFLNARDGHTRYRAIVYYILFYAENIFMLGMWLHFGSEKEDWLYFTAIGAVAGGCVLHIVIQLIYYKTCHPKASDIKIFLHPTEQYNCYQSICHTLDQDEDQSSAANAI